MEGNPGILRWTMELVALAKKVRGKYILTYRFIAYLGMDYIICEMCVKELKPIPIICQNTVSLCVFKKNNLSGMQRFG